MESGKVHLLGPYAIPGFSGPRHVRVYVPHRARAPRPLLFMFDGQNVFDDGPAFAGGWHVHAAVERLATRVPPPVVVAIDHGGTERISELSPFDLDAGPARGPGRAEAFVRFVVADLLRELRPRLAIDPDPRATVVGGSSMGGLAALYAHVAHPEVFGGALAMSPSIWLGRGAMARWMGSRSLAPWSRVYLDAGRREGKGALSRHVGGLAEQLRAKGGRYVLFRDDPKGLHREADWRRRLPAALRFFFGDSKGPPIGAGGSLS
jgi:enterochelin esterase-like enzyme